MSLKKLNERDSRAIDAMLMNGQISPNAPGAAVTGGVPADALAAAARVLRLLDTLPDATPPPGLVERTLERVHRGSFGDDPGVQPVVVPDPTPSA
jgi:hypothetical protein